MKTFLYKARRSLFSCLLLTCSIGFCYAFSLFAPHVSKYFGISESAVQVAFCLNIACLGFGAAFFGALVEKNIKCAAWLSTVLLFIGLCTAGVSIYIKNIWLFYCGLGIFCGISEGIGYVTPVKNLLLFFGRSRHKALIMAVSIVSFGLGSSLCSYIFKYAFPIFGIKNIFFFFALVYVIMMSVGSYLIDKPRFAKLKLKREIEKKYSTVKYISNRYFQQCWLFMFLNISMGLVIIGRCASLLSANAIPQTTVIVIMMLCGLSNGFGRLLFPAISDYIENKLNLLLVLLGIEIVVFSMSIVDPWFIPAAFVLINATYGAAFALLPSVLNDHYGKNELSFVHGLCLSSWGVSSVAAFLISTFVLGIMDLSQNILFLALIAGYSINFLNVLILKAFLKFKSV